MNVGDEVSWVKINKKGRQISMRHLEGEIVAIHGNIATVKYGQNGLYNKAQVALNDLRPANEKGQLTEFVENLAAELRKKESKL